MNNLKFNYFVGRVSKVSWTLTHRSSYSGSLALRLTIRWRKVKEIEENWFSLITKESVLPTDIQIRVFVTSDILKTAPWDTSYFLLIFLYTTCPFLSFYITWVGIYTIITFVQKEKKLTYSVVNFSRETDG